MRTVSKHVLPGFEERELRHGTTPLRYLAGGSGPPLVLVHGLGGAPSNWLRVAPALAAERRVLVPALPGHGGSGRLPAAQTLDPFAEAVLAVLEHEDALPAPWVGHSLGGIVGLRAAVLRPEAVTGLVLAAAAGISSSTPTAARTVALLGHLKPERFVRRHRSRISRSPAGRALTFGWWAVADPGGFDPEMAEAFLEGAALHADTRMAGAALVRSDTRHDLDRVGCPCLCLWGAADNWVPVADGMEYARRLRAPLRLIADCGHLLIGERPDAVVSAVREFLLRLEGG